MADEETVEAGGRIKVSHTSLHNPGGVSSFVGL